MNSDRIDITPSICHNSHVTKTADNKQSYIPGVCNINKAEIAYRRRTMQVGLAITIIFLMVLVFWQVNIFLRSLLLALPLYTTIISYLQVQNAFCVSYGMSGRQNATEGHKTAEKIASKTAVEADKDKARAMVFQALGATAVVVIILLLVPSA